MSFTNFTTGKSIPSADVSRVKPNERIRYTGQIDDPNLPGEIQTTIR